MTDLVFIDPAKLDAVPFTTSKAIAEATGIAHRKIKTAIRKYQGDLECFGLLASYQAESSGGRPEEYGHKVIDPDTAAGPSLEIQGRALFLSQRTYRRYAVNRDSVGDRSGTAKDLLVLFQLDDLFSDLNVSLFPCQGCSGIAFSD